MTTTCKNCKQHFKGKFCNQCGQSADTHDINFHFLWHDIQHGLLHFDKGILYTIKELFTRPGYSIREFIDGKRVKHFKPISFIIVLAGIYGFLIHYFRITEFIQISADNKTRQVVNIDKIIEWISTHYAFSTLLLLPITSLGTYWAFKKEKYNFIQHIVLNSFLAGQKILIRLVFLPLVLLFGKDNGMKILTIPDIIGVGFTIWTLIQLFDFVPINKRIWKIVLSYVFLGILFVVFVLTISVIIGFYTSKLNH